MKLTSSPLAVLQPCITAPGSSPGWLMPVRDYYGIGVVMAPPVVFPLLLAVCLRPVTICQPLLLQVAMVSLVFLLTPFMPVLSVPVVIPFALVVVVIIRFHRHGHKQAGAQ